MHKLYQTLVHLYAKDLYRFAFRLCGDSETAEDLTQETFYEAWRSIGSLQDPEKGRSWLYQIMRHRYSHFLRRRDRRIKISTPIENVENVLVTKDDVLENISFQETLQNALNTIEDKYKEPLLMVFLEGLTCQETASKLNIPVGTVLSRIHRARTALRKALAHLNLSMEKLGQKNIDLCGLHHS